VAAIAGMTFPAIIFVSLLAGDSEALAGWAIPIATDIAFALAVLAVAGRSLPNELRAFLLTVAVVDDLGAISIIAVFYSDTINQQMLLLTVGLLAVYALLQKLNITNWYLLVPLGLVIWWTTYQSGIHATVAGVMIALLTRNKLKVNESLSPAERAEIKIRPISVAIVVPLFAFVAAGVDLRSIGFSQTVSSNIAIGIILALAIGKPVGIFGATYLVTKLTRASLNPTLRWSDVFAIGLLAGIGFTVSLLITELSFGSADALLAEAKVGILAASALSALLAVIMLQVRARRTITS
jgi:NhaA family Na+:H+ antiporter